MGNGWEGAVLCFFPCTAFESKIVQHPLLAKFQPKIYPGDNPRAGSWENPNCFFETTRRTQTSYPVGRRRRISWHTDSSAPPFINHIPTHLGCVRIILCLTPGNPGIRYKLSIIYGVMLINGCRPQKT